MSFQNNLKTTLAGIVVLIGLVGPLTGILTHQQSVALMGLATAFGLTAAADAKKD